MGAQAFSAYLLSMPAGAIEAQGDVQVPADGLSFQCQLVRLRRGRRSPGAAPVFTFNASWCD